MKCYNCGSFLYESEYCATCGCDVSVYKKIVGRSNQMYNKGLEHARARNLTRAVEYLETSLNIYKGNVNARNLLGLVYVEMGEYTKGLAQWVVSKSIQSDNELADYFLAKVQKSQNILDRMQSAIKKYNRAVNYISQGDYDLAEVQLKKLLNDDKKFIKGYHLLALILIRQKEYDRAKSMLLKAEAVDRGNPTTISYLSFVENEIKEAEKTMSSSEIKNKKKAQKAIDEKSGPLNGDDVIIPKGSYKEAAPATLTIIQILVGIIIGAAIVFFIVTPARVSNATSEAASEAASYQAAITELEAEIEELNNAEEEVDDTNELLLAEYELLLEAYAAYADKDYPAAVEYADSITMAYDIDGTFLEVYKMIMTDTSDEEAQAIADEMYSSYISNGHSYWTSAQELLTAYEISPYNEDVLYYLGLCYYELSDDTNAVTYLTIYADRYSSGQYIEEVTAMLEELGGE